MSYAQPASARPRFARQTPNNSGGDSRMPSRPPALEVHALEVRFGAARILQGVDLRLERGLLAVVGRNGMGKTTLCNAIMALVPHHGGSIHILGADAGALSSDAVVALGVGYVPQGRRLWPSLSVHEHLKLGFRRGGKGGRSGRGRAEQFTPERIYELFPRLAERRQSGGGQLSGGEQQMLAIARALLAQPRLLIMDEPTEGLAPVVVEQVVGTLKRLVASGEISILLIEQNLGVAIDLAERIAVMRNGRIARELPSEELARDPALQKRLLGVAKDAGARDAAVGDAAVPSSAGREVSSDARRGPSSGAGLGRFTAWSAADNLRASQKASEAREPNAFSHTWPSAGGGTGAAPGLSAGASSGPSMATTLARPAARTSTEPSGALPVDAAEPPRDDAAPGSPFAALAEPTQIAVRSSASTAARMAKAAYVVGTFDTKGRELLYLKSLLDRRYLRTVTVDLSTSGRPSASSISAREVAAWHPEGERGVFLGERGAAVRAMAQAFARFVAQRDDLGGIISAGGSGGSFLACAGMRALPVGLPKVMVSTLASGDVSAYVGPADITMVHSITDVQGIHRISATVLGNAAHALAGMMDSPLPALRQDKPLLGLTMFGVTTPCVQQVQRALESEYECLVFHATGTGGRAMGKLIDSDLIEACLDITTTEVADMLVGGILPADEDRFGPVIRKRIPFVGSVGAVDVVNFGPRAKVPPKFEQRLLHVHNPEVTLMRTTPAENTAIGRWIAEKLNQMQGPCVFLLPEGGISELDAPGRPFHHPEADAALFEAITQHFESGPQRVLRRVPHHINAPAFADALVATLRESWTRSKNPKSS